MTKPNSESVQKPDIQRAILPIPDRQYLGVRPLNAKDSAAKLPPIEPLRPPQGAPNVLVVLIDDVGFGATSAFGGPVNTPALERLAKNGLKYNRFHTTALCSPTRAARRTTYSRRKSGPTMQCRGSSRPIAKALDRFSENVR
jgi:arylsulfatase